MERPTMGVRERLVVGVATVFSLVGALWGVWVAVSEWRTIPAFIPCACVAIVGVIIAAAGLARSSRGMCGLGLVLGACAPNGFAWAISAIAGSVGIVLLAIVAAQAVRAARAVNG